MTQTIALAGTPFEGLSSQLAAPGNGGEASGLAGLFSGLVGGAQSSGSPAGFTTNLPATAASAGAKADLAAVLEGEQSPGALPVDALAALQALLQKAGLNIKVAQPVAGAVVGMAVAAPVVSPLEALAAALQQVQGALGDAGVAPQDLTSHEGLVRALQALGVASTEADKLAGKIEAALDELKTKLSLGDDQTAVLAQVLLAANVVQGVVPQEVVVQPGQPLTFTVENTAPAAQPAAATAAYYSQANAALKNATALPGAGDFAREVAGLGKTQDTSAEDMPVADAGTADAAVPDSALPLVAVMVDAAGVSVKNVLKADAPAAAPASVSNATLNAVAAADVLAPTGGEAKFVWRGEDHAVAVEAKAAESKGDKLEAAKVEVAVADMGRADARAELLAQAQGARPAADASGFAKQVEQHQQRLELAQRFDVAGQAVVQMKNLVDQGGGAVRVRLNPPELGEIYVELLVKDGAVSGKMSATDPAVVNALASDVKQFGDGLRAAGFKLGNDGLTFMLSQNSHQGQQQGQQRQAQGEQGTSGWTDAGLAADETELANAPVTGWVSPDRLLDMNI